MECRKVGNWMLTLLALLQSATRWTPISMVNQISGYQCPIVWHLSLPTALLGWEIDTVSWSPTAEWGCSHRHLQFWPGNWSLWSSLSFAGEQWTMEWARALSLSHPACSIATDAVQPHSCLLLILAVGEIFLFESFLYVPWRAWKRHWQQWLTVEKKNFPEATISEQSWSFYLKCMFIFLIAEDSLGASGDGISPRKAKSHSTFSLMQQPDLLPCCGMFMQGNNWKCRVISWYRLHLSSLPPHQSFPQVYGSSLLLSKRAPQFYGKRFMRPTGWKNSHTPSSRGGKEFPSQCLGCRIQPKEQHASAQRTQSSIPWSPAGFFP